MKKTAIVTFDDQGFALGSIISAIAFCSYSAPPQSMRKGFLSLIQIIVNIIYIWSYQFSGALDLNIELVDIGFISLDLTQLILVYMGVYFLTVVLDLQTLQHGFVCYSSLRRLLGL